MLIIRGKVVDNLWTKECRVCGKKCGRGVNALSRHVLEHNLTLESYYRKLVDKSVDNVCTTCGGKTSFSLRFKKYNLFCSRKCQAINVANRPEQKKLMRTVMAQTISKLNADKDFQEQKSETARKTIANPNNNFGSAKRNKIA